MIFFWNSQASSDERRERAKVLVRECVNELGITDAEKQKFRSNPEESLNDPKLQKLAKCYFQKAGILDQNGDYQESVAIDKISVGKDRAEIEDILKQCKATAGDNKDEFALRFYACYRGKKPAAH